MVIDLMTKLDRLPYGRVRLVSTNALFYFGHSREGFVGDGGPELHPLLSVDAERFRAQTPSGKDGHGPPFRSKSVVPVGFEPGRPFT